MKKVCVFTLVLIFAVAFYIFTLPDVSSLRKVNPRKTAFMEYCERQWKKEGKRYRVKQIWVPLSRVSPYLVKAVLIGEDDKFWRHEGFDYDAIQKAIEKDIKAERFKFGASTISQQLVKNLYLSPSKNPLRKIKEAIITWRMERVLSKRRILELYLNVVEWGDGGIFGIEAASRHYYGKPASALGPEEAARLASVLPNPIRFNPLSDSRYVVNRSRLIYNIMLRRGIIPPEYEDVTDSKADTPALQNEGPVTVSPLEQKQNTVPLKQ